MYFHFENQIGFLVTHQYTWLDPNGEMYFPWSDQMDLVRLCGLRVGLSISFPCLSDKLSHIILNFLSLYCFSVISLYQILNKLFNNQAHLYLLMPYCFFLLLNC